MTDQEIKALAWETIALGYDLDAAIKAQGRIGQAFMNGLPYEDYNRLTGSIFDPFYSDDWQSVGKAIDYLTR